MKIRLLLLLWLLGFIGLDLHGWRCYNFTDQIASITAFSLGNQTGIISCSPSTNSTPYTAFQADKTLGIQISGGMGSRVQNLSDGVVIVMNNALIVEPVPDWKNFDISIFTDVFTWKIYNFTTQAATVKIYGAGNQQDIIVCPVAQAASPAPCSLNSKNVTSEINKISVQLGSGSIDLLLPLPYLYGGAIGIMDNGQVIIAKPLHTFEASGKIQSSGEIVAATSSLTADNLAKWLIHYNYSGNIHDASGNCNFFPFRFFKPEGRDILIKSLPALRNNAQIFANNTYVDNAGTNGVTVANAIINAACNNITLPPWTCSGKLHKVVSAGDTECPLTCQGPKIEIEVWAAPLLPKAAGG